MKYILMKDILKNKFAFKREQKNDTFPLRKNKKKIETLKFYSE